MRTSEVKSTNTRVVILADGRTKGVHLDNFRMLTRIKGQPLIVRTVYQFSKWANVCVVTSDPTIIEALRGHPARILAGSDKSDYYGGVDMIRKGLDWCWNRRSFIVFGDVVWTDDAVAKLESSEIAEFAVYGRSGPSKLLGTPYAEYFAIGVNWAGREKGKQAVETVAKHYREGDWLQCTAWEWYHTMEGMPWEMPHPARPPIGEHWVEIDDATDDIDVNDDIERLRRHHE